MMTYEETVEYLFHVTPVFEKTGASAYKEGLSNTHALDEHFGHPHRQFKTIHVAGTNVRVLVPILLLPSCNRQATRLVYTPLPIL